MNYQEAVAFLRGREQRNLPMPNTRAEWRAARGSAYPERVIIRLHSTAVVTIYSDGRRVLNSGGYMTMTTKDRMNRYAFGTADTDNNVRQRLFVWQVTYHGQEHAYADGMTLHPDGRVTYDTAHSGRGNGNGGTVRVTVRTAVLAQQHAGRTYDHTCREDCAAYRPCMFPTVEQELEQEGQQDRLLHEELTGEGYLE